MKCYSHFTLLRGQGDPECWIAGPDNF